MQLSKQEKMLCQCDFFLSTLFSLAENKVYCIYIYSLYLYIVSEDLLKKVNLIYSQQESQSN